MYFVRFIPKNIFLKNTVNVIISVSSYLLILGAYVIFFFFFFGLRSWTLLNLLFSAGSFLTNSLECSI